MTFIEFKNNVELWAAERGIYDHSSTSAQLMKALSELGELADAIIKGDDDALKDAVGDVAVCVVNAAYMEGFQIFTIIDDCPRDPDVTLPYVAVGLMAEGIGDHLSGHDGCRRSVIDTLGLLKSLCAHKGLDFMDCCEHAWNEIKDRKGRMVAGGAFVKEREEQKQDGGPAFPQGKEVGDVWLSKGGMTLRDYFAAKAMQSMVSCKFSEDFRPDNWAEYVYEIADAMLKERNK